MTSSEQNSPSHRHEHHSQSVVTPDSLFSVWSPSAQLLGLGNTIWAHRHPRRTAEATPAIAREGSTRTRPRENEIGTVREETHLRYQEERKGWTTGQLSETDIFVGADRCDQNACKVMAKDLVRTRRYVQKFYQMRTQLQAVGLRIQTLRSNQQMAEAMRGATRVRCCSFPVP